jgi:hypothetical protein
MTSKRFRKSNRRSRRNRRQRGGVIDDNTKTLITELLNTSGIPTPVELNRFIDDNNLTTIPRWDIINYIRQLTGRSLTPTQPLPPTPPTGNGQSFVNSNYFRSRE